MPQTIRKSLDYVKEQLESGDELNQALLNESLGWFAMTVIGLALLMGIFMYFMRQTIIVMSRLIEYDMRKDLYDHFQQLDISFYKKNKTGDIMSRISEDVSKVRMYVGPAILYGINLVSLSVLVISSMLNVSVKLTLYTLLPLPFLSVSIYYVSMIIHKKSGVIQKQLSQLTSVAQEAYSGIAVVKSYVQEKSFVNYFKSESESFKDKSLDLAKVNALFFPLMILLISSSTLLTIYMGGIEVASGNISYGNIAEFVIYVNYLSWPFMAVGWVASTIQQAEASQERINDFLQIDPLIENPSEEKLTLAGKIEFKNVHFTYPETGVKALTDVSFTLNPGDKLAIIGKTASGKSTIAELLLRTYDVNEGQILYDGKKIDQLNLGDLRKQIGYVPQDVFLFSETIEKNIQLGHPDADLSRVQEYADYAAVNDDIIKLPESYKTFVGERGVTLSGGQKQRISLARAFIKEPKVILLDDCLSAVDTATERKILNYIKNATVDKTAIIITHRVYSLLDFDKIIILEDGKIIEEGNHAQLLEKNGVYKELYEHQEVERETS